MKDNFVKLHHILRIPQMKKYSLYAMYRRIILYMQCKEEIFFICNITLSVDKCRIHTCDISLFRRDLPIFDKIFLFGISEFPYIPCTSPYLEFSNPEIPSLFNHSPYLEREISLSGFSGVSHVCV